MATDASLFKYGVAILSGHDIGTTFSDFWASGDNRPIHLKEADAIFKALSSMVSRVAHSRVDILTDNMAVIQLFENQGGKCRFLNNIMKQIFAFLCSYNVDLHLRYVPTNLNEADFPSRQLSLADSTLAGPSWMLVERLFRPHTVDLMAVDSNAMKSSDGMSLRHFTPGPSPLSSGVNIFSQNISCETNPYVFPPIDGFSACFLFEGAACSGVYLGSTCFAIVSHLVAHFTVLLYKVSFDWQNRGKRCY